MRDLLLGLSIGFAAGISPGPLMLLVVTATLRLGWRAGVLTAISPLITDLVVVTLVLIVLDQLPMQALGLLGVIGGLFVILLGAQTIIESRDASLPAGVGGSLPAGSTLRRASVMNLTSPHPWIAWATALGPLTVATYQRGAGGAVALVAGFYAALVGSKVILAVTVSGARRKLDDRRYRSALRLAGGLLVLLGVLLAAEFGHELATR
ncbi:MAG: LysE family transporter [Candidatus Nanopelagicales bacterium]